MFRQLRSLLMIAVALSWGAQATMAQQEWTFQSAFWPQTLEDNDSSLGGHGIAVDPDGKVWFQFFSATDSVQVPELGNAWTATRVIYVFNSDGTDASFSPIKFLGPNCDSDTLGGKVILNAQSQKAWDGRSGRGLRADHNGNILASQFDTLYRLDYRTGECMTKAVPFVDLLPDNQTLAQVSADAAGNVYVGRVFPGGPLRVLSESFFFVENVAPAQSQFSRGHLVSTDGLRFYETDYENTFTIIHEKADEFSAWDSVDVAFRGMRTESAAIHPTSGRVWVSSGNPLNLVNQDTTVVTDWITQSFYSFDTADLSTPLEFFTWNNAASGSDQGRPRGLAFSPDGMTAYVTFFGTTGPSIQTFSPGAVGVEPVDSDLPGAFTLKQNYPNPFNPTTTIEFDLQAASMTFLRVYDVLGRQVAELVNEPLAAGSYRVAFDASELSSGTYMYVLEAGSQRQSASMTILK